MSLMRFIVLISAAASLIGCASAPVSPSIGIATEQPLSVVKDGRSVKIAQFIDIEAVRAARSVTLAPVEVANDAHDGQISAAQAALVANRAGRALCSKLSPFFVLDATPSDLSVRLVMTQISPTSAATSGASAVVGIAVPGPFRIPSGLGGLAADGSAQSSDGRQRIVKRWSRGANPVFNDAKVSSIGDAYQLAASFASDFSSALIKPSGPREKLRPRLDKTTIAANRAACLARFGSASMAGRGASILLPLAPEAIDSGAPVIAPKPSVEDAPTP